MQITWDVVSRLTTGIDKAGPNLRLHAEACTRSPATCGGNAAVVHSIPKYSRAAAMP